MKTDIGTNYTPAQGLAPVSVSAGTDAGASIDHSSGSCGMFILNTGVFGSAARITMKGQYSDDDSRNSKNNVITDDGNDRYFEYAGGYKDSRIYREYIFPCMPEPVVNKDTPFCRDVSVFGYVFYDRGGD